MLTKYITFLSADAGKFDSNRKKTHGEARHTVEVQISYTKIDWDSVMDATNSHLADLQDNILLAYEAQKPNIVHLYPQAVANTNGIIFLVTGCLIL